MKASEWGSGQQGFPLVLDDPVMAKRKTEQLPCWVRASVFMLKIIKRLKKVKEQYHKAAKQPGSC